jgi:hypothetical protein
MSQEKKLQSVVYNFRVFIVSIILGLFIVAAAGCATTEEVKGIVKKSNETMLMSMLPGAGLPTVDGDSASPGNWEEDSGKIDALIAANPEEKVLASALRIRQAMLLLAYKQYNLASASFEMAVKDDLKTQRDQALYDLRDHLIWWFAQDKNRFFNDDFVKGDNALREFQKIINTLDASPDIHDYLAEMRAYIALQMSLKSVNLSDGVKYFGEGMNQYVNIFKKEEIELLLKHKENPKEILKNRRQIRALAIIEKAIKVSGRVPGSVDTVKDTAFATLLK